MRLLGIELPILQAPMTGAQLGSLAIAVSNAGGLGSLPCGHRGMFLTDDVTTQLGTLALVLQIVAAASVPVIAAGGIADAAGVAAVLRLGAAAAQLGTAYLLCPEASTSPLLFRALGAVDARHTALTILFTGRPRAA